MYLESRDTENMKRIYMSAWKKGLKTTYYLHMKPRHTAEQSTTTVNKGAAMGKRGFAAVSVAAPVPSPVSVAAPVAVQAARAEHTGGVPEDPAEGPNVCVSCQ
jgi:ribonucleoside-diphosphate reductase alpha chain